MHRLKASGADEIRLGHHRAFQIIIRDANWTEHYAYIWNISNTKKCSSVQLAIRPLAGWQTSRIYTRDSISAHADSCISVNTTTTDAHNAFAYTTQSEMRVLCTLRLERVNCRHWASGASLSGKLAAEWGDWERRRMRGCGAKLHGKLSTWIPLGRWRGENDCESRDIVAFECCIYWTFIWKFSH